MTENNIRDFLVKIFYIGFFGFIFTLNLRAIMDPDFFWHLKTGEYIAMFKSIPSTNIFSFMFPDIKWLNHEWLSQVLFYYVYSAGGFISLIYFKAVIVTAAFIFLYLTLKKISGCSVISLVLTALSVRLSLPLFTLRPHIFSYFLLSVLMYLLYLHDKRGKKLYQYLIPAIMLLWVNLHGMYIMGMVVLAIFTFSEGLKESQLLKIFPALCAVLLINPYTYKTLIYPFTYLVGEGRLHTHYLQEWQSINFHEGYAGYLLIFFFLNFAGMMFYKPHKSSSKNIKLREILLFFSFFYLGLSAYKNIPVMMFVISPFTAFLLGESSAFIKVRDKLKIWDIRHPWHFFPAHIMLVFMPLLFFFTFYNMNKTIFHPPISVQVRGIDTSRFPHLAVKYLKENDFSDKRMLNLYKWGGYLIWRLYPQYKVFADGRGIMFPGKFLVRYFEFARLKTDWKKFLSDYKIEVILWEKNSPLSAVLAESADWKKVFNDDIAEIYIRNK